MTLSPIRTTCPYCGVGCGVLVSREDDDYKVRGDPEHPANLGRLCSKGAALGETLSLDDRLLHPEIDGVATSWDIALDTVANRFRDVIAEHGPDAVAFYVSGQLLTEDYYVANKLMKGFIGSGNIDTNSRLCMSSAVAAHKRAFGADSVPACYEDLELADLVVLVGSNAAWAHPVVFQRLVAAKKARPEMKVVLIDPRRTATAEILQPGADLHLAIKPGADAWLFNGLLNHLKREDALNWAYIEAHVEGFGAALQAVSGVSIPQVAQACGLTEADVAAFFRLFAHTPRTVTLFSQGINQSSSGVDKGNAIINCHLATGRVGLPGASPFSITGQPNAMGGREVGGLANQLAAHMDFSAEAIDRVGRFWRAPNMAQQPGLKAVDMFRAVDDGRIKALWIIATNPAVSLPQADDVVAALRKCPFVVVSDVVARTDTSVHAHVRLPAAAWGEKDGTVTNSERRISRQRAFLPLPGEARPDWWIVDQVARRMGHAAAFAFTGPAQIFNEHAALSGFENDTARDFDLSGLLPAMPVKTGMSAENYDALQPVQWPVTAQGGTSRLFADGRFFTPSGRARMVPISPRAPVHAVDAAHPFTLNTGRIRDQWHTMTRTAMTPKLLAHIAEPYIEIHPDDARRAGLTEGALARVSNAHGELLARVQVGAAQQRGSVFAPIHWNAQFSARGRVDVLAHAVTDPISGQPEFKQTPVAVEAYAATWQGFVMTRAPLDCGKQTGYWSKIRGKACWRHEIAGIDQPADWPADWSKHMRDWLALPGDWIEMADRAAGRYRGALIRDEQVQAVYFLEREAAKLPPRHWLESLFEREALSNDERSALLLGRPSQAVPDCGRIVCACFGVGENELNQAIASGAASVEALGIELKAGSNCGSCIPELKRLLQRP
ncbi:MAG: nitrate reductase [Hydrogenophilales bacterium 28-61-23]|nr:MAG: nitrate reductase [Hydrogenophilales bacterium 28-61-23]